MFRLRGKQVHVMPKQHEITTSIALKLREHGALFLFLVTTLALQLIGVKIFSGNAIAGGGISYVRSLTASPTALDAPRNVLTDSLGNVYVGDDGNGKIRKFDKSGNLVTEWDVAVDTPFSMFNAAKAITMTMGPQDTIYVALNASTARNVNGTINYATYDTGGNLLATHPTDITSTIYSIAVSPDGTVYLVADGGIRRVDGWTVTSSLVSFAYPSYGMTTAIATDLAGNLYSNTTGSIKRYTADGSVVWTNGAPGAWCGASMFNVPVPGITADRNGYIYATGNGAISKFTPDGQKITTQTTEVVGSCLNPLPGFTLSNVMSGGIAVDVSQGLIYTSSYFVNDTTHGSSVFAYSDNTYNVRVSTEEAKDITQTTATLRGASADLSDAKGLNYTFELGTDTSYGLNPNMSNTHLSPTGQLTAMYSTEGSGDGELSQPSGITVNNNVIYVADNANARIQWFNMQGQYVGKYGSYGSGDGQFISPNGIAVAPNGNRYVVDSTNNNVQYFDKDWNFLGKWGSTGSGDMQFNNPRDIVVDQAGFVYVANRSKIKKYTADGSFVTSWNFYDNSTLNSILGLTITPQNKLLVFGTSYDGPGSHAAVTYNLDGTVVVTKAYPGIYSASGSVAADEYGYAYLSKGGPFSGNAIYPVNSSLNDVNNGKTFAYYSTLADISWTTSGFAMSLNDGLFAVRKGASSNITQYKGIISATANNLTCGTTYHYRTKVMDGYTAIYGEDQTFTTADCDVSSVAITTDSLPDGRVGDYYYQTVLTDSAATLSVQSGDLPTGLSMDSYGNITGTPTQAGSYTFTVEASNGSSTDTKQFTVTIDEAAPLPISFCDNFLTAYLHKNTTYNGVLCTQNGFGPKAFTVTAGSLPPGMSLNPITGALSGAPTAVGTYPVTFKVEDLTGQATEQFTLVVKDAYGENPILKIDSPSNGTTFSHDHDSVVVSGTGPYNQLLEVSMDNQLLGTVTTDAQGNWSYTANNIFPGQHEFKATWMPVNDLAYMTNISEDNYLTVSIIDTVTKQSAFNLDLPDYFLPFTSELNHAKTKLYLIGSTYDPQTELFSPTVVPYNLATGYAEQPILMPTYDGTLGAFASQLTISDDDQTAYIAPYPLLPSEENQVLDAFPIYKINLATNIATELANVQYATVDAALFFYYSGYYVTGVFNSPLNVAGNGSIIYSAASTIAYDDHVSVTAIDTTNGQTSEFTLSEDPGFIVAHTTASNGDVYYVTVTSPDQVSLTTKLIRIDHETHQIAQSYDLSINPIVNNNEIDVTKLLIAMTVDPVANKAYMLDRDTLYTLDMGSQQLTPLNLGVSEAPFNIAIDPDRSNLYISYGRNDIPLTRVFVLGDNQFLMDDGLPFDGYFNLGRDYIGKHLTTSNKVAITISEAPVVQPPVVQPPTDQPPTVTPPPTKPPSVDANPEPPTVTDVTPPSNGTKSSSGNPSRINSTNQPAASSNSLLGLVARLPQPIAVGFPWLLLLLALILVLSQYYQVHSEQLATKKMQNSVLKQQQLVEEQNNFVALTTHYLHTPLTVMEGEIALMVKAGTISEAQATKLKAALASLSTESEQVLRNQDSNPKIS